MIVFIGNIPSRYVGESENLWQRTAQWMLAQGKEVGICLCYLGPLPPALESLQKTGAVFHFRRSNKAPAGKNALWLPRLKKMLKKQDPGFPGDKATLEWIVSQNPDLVVVCLSENYDGSAWIEKLSGKNIPFVTVAQNGAVELWPTDYYINQLLPGMQVSRRNYFPSDKTIQWTEMQFGAPIPNTGLYYNCPGTSYRPDIRWPEDRGILRLAMVSEIDARSRAFDLVFLVLAADEWRKRKVELNIYGKGPSMEGLQRLAAYWKLDQVCFKGEAANPEAVWRENHFLIEAARFDGLSCSVMEAMLCGRGAIVTDVGGNAGLIKDNVSGFVAVHPAKEELALAMERCWMRRTEAKEIGLEARRRAEELFPEKPEAVFGRELLELAGN